MMHQRKVYTPPKEIAFTGVQWWGNKVHGGHLQIIKLLNPLVYDSPLCCTWVYAQTLKQMQQCIWYCHLNVCRIVQAQYIKRVFLTLDAYLLMSLNGNIDSLFIQLKPEGHCSSFLSRLPLFFSNFFPSIS